ncbi:MAG TPA: CapA family protein [Geobacteraceae bacterium]|nr:CapA family protein [Geobacteraceae bacterium]
MRKLTLLFLLLALPTAALAGPVVINAVGDIMLAGSGTGLFNRTGYDYPFLATSSELHRGDITIGNLESPITRSGEEFKGKKYRFRSAPAAAAALQRAGFNHLSLANNHILDFGATGLRETIAILDGLGISHAGAGSDLGSARQMSIVTVKGIRIALLAYSLTYPAEFYASGDRAGTAPGYESYYRSDIARAKKSADYVVVSFHWGTECDDSPRTYQKNTAHMAIDAGADVVLGHHPHVLQGIEYYKDGVVFYSLGNFTFASRSRKADRSMIARITLDNGISAVEVIPLNVLYGDVKFQPRLLDAAGGDGVVKRLARLSAKMGTVISPDNGRYLVERRQQEIGWQ